jgi:hypothetical protein
MRANSIEAGQDRDVRARPMTVLAAAAPARRAEAHARGGDYGTPDLVGRQRKGTRPMVAALVVKYRWQHQPSELQKKRVNAPTFPRRSSGGERPSSPAASTPPLFLLEPVPCETGMRGEEKYWGRKI